MWDQFKELFSRGLTMKTTKKDFKIRWDQLKKHDFFYWNKFWNFCADFMILTSASGKMHGKY